MNPKAALSHRHPGKSGAPEGFSLVELLVVSVISVIVLLAIYMVLDTSHRDYVAGAAKSDVQQNVRVALESMARELRMAGYAPSNASNTDCPLPPCGITAFTSSSVTFQADVDLTTSTDKVIFTFVPPTDATKPCDPSDAATVGRITRSVQSWLAGAWSLATPTPDDVAQCVTALTLTYFDSSGNVTTTPANVRRITISITGTENVRGWTARTYTLTSDVRLRIP